MSVPPTRFDQSTWVHTVHRHGPSRPTPWTSGYLPTPIGVYQNHLNKKPNKIILGTSEEERHLYKKKGPSSMVPNTMSNKINERSDLLSRRTVHGTHSLSISPPLRLLSLKRHRCPTGETSPHPLVRPLEETDFS